MSDASEYLVEIGAQKGADPVTLRYSTKGFTSQPGDTPANAHYASRISDPGTLTRHMFAAGRTMGEAEMDLGDITLLNGDGKLDELIGYAFDSRDVTMLRVAPRGSLATARSVFKATAERIDAERGSDVLRLRYYDRRRAIDKPIQTNRYGGTTVAAGVGADGTADMKDLLKPLVFGVAKNVVPVIANPFDLVLQVNDGAVTSIVLYDGGVQLTNDGDVATLALLVAAAISPGRYKTCLALGLVRPGGAFRGRAAFVWTADVTEGAVGQRHAAAVVTRILAKMGLAGDAIDAASFAALGAAAPQILGLFLDSETTGVSAMREILDSVGGYLLPDQLGRFTVGQFTGVGTPTVTLRDTDIIGDAFGLEANPDADGGMPAYKVILRWGRNFKVFGETDIGNCVTAGDPDRAANLRKEYRETVKTDAAIQTLHPLAPEMTIDTLLTVEADATAERDRRFALYSVDRFVSRVTVARETAETLPLNTTVTVLPGMLTGPNGKAMVVIGQSHDHAAETVTLTLWG